MVNNKHIYIVDKAQNKIFDLPHSYSLLYTSSILADRLRSPLLEIILK